MRQITITAGSVSLKAELVDNDTGNAIFDALPIKGHANVWGDEIYFGIPITLGSSDDARDEMGIGELAYWPPGHAFCIFYGRTPASIGNEPRAASAANPFGNIIGDATVFRQIADGTEVIIEEA